MVRKSFTPEQIINKLREAEILLSQGATIVEASRKIGVTGQTCYRWRKEYGGLRIEQEVLGGWLVGWTRGKKKVNVNPRFMTRYGDSKWETNYEEAIASCVLDTISSFLYLIYKKYRIGNSPINFL